MITLYNREVKIAEFDSENKTVTVIHQSDGYHDQTPIPVSKLSGDVEEIRKQISEAAKTQTGFTDIANAIRILKFRFSKASSSLIVETLRQTTTTETESTPYWIPNERLRHASDKLAALSMSTPPPLTDKQRARLQAMVDARRTDIDWRDIFAILEDW